MPVVFALVAFATNSLRPQARRPVATKDRSISARKPARVSATYLAMQPAFQSFDPRKEVSATHRNLPHWQQPGATYFVTFRLNDALPREACEQLEEMRRLNTHETFEWIERYLDAGSGACVLRDTRHAETIAATLRFADGQRYALGAFVVMPNHVHALVQPLGPSTLTSVLHSWKSYTANRLQRHAGLHGKVWQEESFDRLVRDENELVKFQTYIANNPASARLPRGEYLLRKGLAPWAHVSL